jgi:hypothetical protein
MTRTLPKASFRDTEPGENHLPPGFQGGAPNADLVASSQMVYLRIQEDGKYVNINASGWAVLESTASTQYVLVQYYGNHYIVVASGDYKNSYLSYNKFSYVGAYPEWDDASYWAVDPVDCSPYPGLYPYGDSPSYLCCNGVKDAIDKIVTVVSY